MLPVVETFYSIQGEGPFAGNPSVFVRLGGCNLKCEGFGCTTISPIDGSTIKGCDSIPAVATKHFRQEWSYIDEFKELVEMINSTFPVVDELNFKPDIVITGGEPTIHSNNQILIDTVTYYISRGHKVSFETNGSQNVDFDRNDIFKDCTFVMSVKLSNSGEHYNKRININNINSILKNSSRSSCFKFVFNKNTINVDNDEIMDILKQVPFYSTIYIMPQGETTEIMNKNSKAAWEYATSNGFKYTDRLHIRVFEDLIGV
jgi:organic radical activating enzyme